MWSIAPEDVKVTPSGVPGEDITFSQSARMQFPYSIECKNQEKLNIWESLNQCEKNSNGNTPLLVFTRNRSKTYVVMEIESFLDIHFRK